MRRWLITGTSSGLGLALAEAVLALGDDVVGTVRRPDAAAAFEALAPGRARAALLDLTDRRGIAELVDTLGPFDVLVNNAGFSLEGVVEATEEEDIVMQLAVHFLAPLAFIRAVLPGMRERRSGHILNLGSLAAHCPAGGTSIYAAAKAAIETLSYGLANEVAPFGIRVTAVVPGAFRTELGTSRRSAMAQMADYAEADVDRRQRLAAMQGRQRGDPARAAQAIIRIVEAEEAVTCLPLGPDALAGLRASAKTALCEAERWEALARSTDLDDADQIVIN